MKVFCRILAFVFLCSFANSGFALVLPETHLTGKDYRTLLKMNGIDQKAEELQPMIDMGERLYRWIDHINTHRDSPLSLSSPASQPSTPITSPRYNSRQIITAAAKEFRNSVPAWFESVIFEEGHFTDELPVAEDEFLIWGQKADRLYSQTARWLLQEPFLYAYEMRKNEDVRGYYHLTHTEQIEKLLTDWTTLTSHQQTDFKTWLVNLCENTTSTSACQKAATTAIAGNKVLEFFKKYLPRSQQVWKNYFRIEGARDDVDWTSARSNEFYIPFERPDDEAVEKFLVDNIEDEFKWLGWRLVLDFVSDFFDAPNVVFEPGVTPHVDCLGCSRITMDANVPITDYAVQWTIRHEFGHVLGFPDCYVEFFDRSLGKMVYYQLDTENLMCSRRGKFMKTHYDELRKAYFQE